MANTLKHLAVRLITWPVRLKLRREYHQQHYRLNERPLEYCFALKTISDYHPRTVLDVGPGTSAWPSLVRTCGCIVTAMDEMGSYWNRAVFSHHYHVLRDDITAHRIRSQFDMVTCISTLEHIPNHRAAVENMFSLLRPGGLLVLTFPYDETTYKANAYDLPGSSYGQNAPYVCQIFSRTEVNQWMGDTSCDILQQEYYDCFEGAYWSCGERKLPPIKTTASAKHELTLLLLQRR